jgi:hypothetical protein
MTARPLALFGALLALGACGAPHSSATDAGGDAPTYYRDVQPLLDQHCVMCHQSGGIAPFSLETYANAQEQAQRIAGETKAKVMPPWPPDDTCNSYQSDRALTEAQIDTLQKWAAAGAPQGNPSDQKSNVTGGTPANPFGRDADLVVKNPTPYVSPPTSDTDDYHCFVSDPQLTADRDVIGVNIVPGNGSIVHHVILYEVEQKNLDKLAQLDPTGQGYTCFGDAKVDANWVATWAPGGTAIKFPDTTGIRLHAGSKLVMQVHYNLLNGRGQSDQSQTQLYFSPTPVENVASIYPIIQYLFQLPAGQSGIEVPFTYTLTASDGNARIWGVAGHMHLLGTAWKMDLEKGDHSSDQCLLHIPSWNFHWQGMYFLDQPVLAVPGDMLHMKCVYDNSAANQPVINGDRQEPRDVTWGEGTTDEMCLGLVYVTQ